MEREENGVWESTLKLTKDCDVRARAEAEPGEVHLRFTGPDGQGIEIKMDFLDSAALRRLLEHAEEKILGPDLHKSPESAEKEKAS